LSFISTLFKSKKNNQEGSSMFNEITGEEAFYAQTIKLSTGKLARQAAGAVRLQVGNMVLLAAVTRSKEPREGIDFFPLTIEYVEKMYAAGKIPGGFFKREARPSTDSTLIARLIDRPLRPCFPKGFNNDVQIVITQLSFDPDVVVDPYAIIAASAALAVSDLPFNGPIGAALVGRINGEYVVNPSPSQLEQSEISIVVAGTKEAVLMVEAGANEVSEAVVIEAIMKAHEAIRQSIAFQEKWSAPVIKEKLPVAGKSADYSLVQGQINAFLGSKIEDNLQSLNKQEVEDFLKQLEKDAKNHFINEDGSNKALVMTVYNELKKDKIRKLILSKKIRVDGRKTTEIRPLDIEVGVLPSVHGSSLFTRGETQSLGIVTLGTEDDEQIIDGLADSERSKYYFHYNFPPYSVGEVGFIRTGRRELGHGALAERALRPILPKHDKFPYTIRIVSEILESNGSSSMASVCSGSLSLMDCGVPVKAAVSGIAMGLLIEGNDYIILSDIAGLEDHYGDMDFKVAGTKDGITALQLDIKVSGLSKEILENALAQAKEGRLYILDKMNTVIDAPRRELNDNAPKMHSIFIDPSKIGAVIGTGGKVIRSIESESGATVTIKEGDTGEIIVSAVNKEQLNKALKMIEGVTKEPEIGEIYEGKVVKTATFGAFIEICPGKEGLLHISKIAKERVNNVEDHLKVGDLVKVKVVGVDEKKRISLDRLFE